MKRSAVLCLLVATLAVAAASAQQQQDAAAAAPQELLPRGAASRELQGFDISKLDLSKLPTLPALGLLPPGVALPPLKDFLPPLESINLPPLNDFLKSVGLPTWQEMNLPPISEFMKPVFDPEAVQLPNLQDVMKQANATFTATVKDIVGNIPLPPGVKLPELKLPPLNLDKIDALAKLSNLKIDPANLPKLPSLEQVVKVVGTIQEGRVPSMAEVSKLVPTDLLKKLPPPNEIIKTLQPMVDTAARLAKNTDFSKLDINTLLTPQNLAAVGKVMKNLPKVEGLDKLPSFDTMAKLLSTFVPAGPKPSTSVATAAAPRAAVAPSSSRSLLEADAAEQQAPAYESGWEQLVARVAAMQAAQAQAN